MTDITTDAAAYVGAGGELDLLTVAAEQGAPVLLLGPTGCGKTVLVEALARDLGRELVTVTCHDDLTTADLVGRHLIRGGDVVWQDGPLTTAMRDGAVCYLDEVIEARADTLAVLHSVADHRRTLYVDRLDAEVVAHPDFLLAASYNPRGPGAAKELKTALRQRFVTVSLDYLPADEETGVVADRGGVDRDVARRLVAGAGLLREAATRDLHERFDPPSTRALVTAARLVRGGAAFDVAFGACVLGTLEVDPGTRQALAELVDAQQVR
ncbi:AAA family ATPase [Conexibacter sp. SYSU D00693]|uniref:AAA family ATPase n=1 Tax=Conexibacter sp. SYSU D00693 TaxID=2812560 RepID=UPI00196A62F3|nr:AAA family ATPase [Conexibacter sp. SYSU D00693]